MAEVRTAHMLRGRGPAVLHNTHEGACGISLDERLPEIDGLGVAGELDKAGAKLAPAHGHKVRREADGDRGARGSPELLLCLRYMAMLADAVRREPLAGFREQNVLLERADR